MVSRVVISSEVGEINMTGVNLCVSVGMFYRRCAVDCMSVLY